MAKHIVKCRICHKEFDTEKDDFVRVGDKSYYHKTCYDDWVKNRNVATSAYDADFWKESVIDFLYRDVKMTVNFSKLNNQWDNFTKPERKMTPKGIYFAVRYFFEVQNGNVEKSLGGIGIVPYIYKTSCEYWTDREEKRKGTLDAIIEQIKARKARPVQIITRKEQKKDKSKWNLDDI